jgi:hypothetical protein
MNSNESWERDLRNPYVRGELFFGFFIKNVYSVNNKMQFYANFCSVECSLNFNDADFLV